jgi:hypothetical protein
LVVDVLRGAMTLAPLPLGGDHETDVFTSRPADTDDVRGVERKNRRRSV